MNGRMSLVIFTVKKNWRYTKQKSARPPPAQKTYFRNQISLFPCDNSYSSLSYFNMFFFEISLTLDRSYFETPATPGVPTH